MKKTAMLAGAAFTLLTASVTAQTTTTTDTVPKQQNVTTTTTTSTETAVSKDKYNNWSADTYKMQPMPEALTQEKVFPVIGKYQVSDKEGTASEVTISLDPANKGMVWVEGLPQGKIKANLRKSPAVYKIPAQKLGDDPTAKDAKEIAEGVLIFDKDANTLNVCLGCTYNAENPAVAFDAAAATEEQPEATAAPKKSAKAKSAKAKAPKVAKIKPVRYTGTKVIEQTAAVQQ